MIRIIDEPVFEMTQEEHSRLSREYSKYWASPAPPHTTTTFEDWLEHVKGWPHTRSGRLKP